MLGTVPTMDTHVALCCLTLPAPRTAWHGESCPGHCSLRISVQDQLLPSSLGKSALGSRQPRDSRPPSPHDGLASAPTRPRLSTLSTYSDQHVVHSMCHALRQAVIGAPTSHRIRRDRRVALVHRGQDRSVDHAATVTSTGLGHTASTHKTPRSERMYRPCPPLQL